MSEQLNQSVLGGGARRMLWIVLVTALLVTTLTTASTQQASAAAPVCDEGVQVGLYCTIQTDEVPTEGLRCPVSSTVVFVDGECFARLGFAADGSCGPGTTLDPSGFFCRREIEARMGLVCTSGGAVRDGACFSQTLVPGVVLECPEGFLVRNTCRVEGRFAQTTGWRCPLGVTVLGNDDGCYTLTERVGGVCPSSTTDDSDSNRCRRPIDLRPLPSRCEVGLAKSNNECRRFVQPTGLPELDCLGSDAGAPACKNRHLLNQPGNGELVAGVTTEIVFFQCPGIDPGLFIEDHIGRVQPAMPIFEREPGVYVGSFQVDQPGPYAFTVSVPRCTGGQPQPLIYFGATFAGEPTDLVLCNNRHITIKAAEGVPTLGTPSDDVILGTAGDDIIDGLGGHDSICSLGGDDTIDGGSGNDAIDAGDGNDVAIGGDGNDDIAGGTGQDVLRGGPGADRVAGGPGNDRVLGGIGDDRLDGNDGDDYLGGFGGKDTIDGGAGNEIIFGGFGADLILGGEGDDKIFGLIGDDLIIGGTGADTINGDRGNDEIFGSAGNDTIQGGNANDTIYGREGDDTIGGGRADDVLSGGDGEDSCSGNKQNSGGDTADDTCEFMFGIP